MRFSPRRGPRASAGSGACGRPARSRRVGVFAKARPGVMFIGELTSGFNCSGGASARTCSVNHNNLALDAGGVLELYPSSRAVARVEAGDRVVRVRNANGGGILFAPTLTAGGTTHSFQFGVGFGYRF